MRINVENKYGFVEVHINVCNLRGIQKDVFKMNITYFPAHLQEIIHINKVCSIEYKYYISLNTSIRHNFMFYYLRTPPQ